MFASRYGQDSIVGFLLENYSDHCIVDAQNYSSQFDCIINDNLFISFDESVVFF